MRPRPSPVAIVSSVVLIIGLVTPVGAEPIAPPAAEAAPDAAVDAGQVRLRHIDGGLTNPVGIANAGDGTNRLFVVEQRGTVRVIQNDALKSGYFLDLRGGVPGGISSGGERGLLGLAFHPDFDTNRYLFVYYTDAGGDLVIAELRANAGKTSVPLSSYDEIMSIEHSSRSNHNGGQLLFGPDGYLYIFTGDGGGGGDPDENGQDINQRLGKTLRVAPDLSGGYASPSTNPYHGSTPGLGEIWSIGLRNPWRASFDRETDALWIADVGQGSWEEINREPTGAGGRNYGWDCREGNHPYESTGCSGSFTNPVAEYGHSGGNCSITGGYVYRGDVFEDFRGQYVFGDFCSGRIWTLPAGASSPTLKLHRDTSEMISSFGESENGEIFMTDYANGDLFRVIAPPFSDVTDSKFLDDIMWAYNEKVTTGCTSDRFCPKSVLTRGQMASFIARALHLPTTSTDFFGDDNDSAHEANINRIAHAGITTGCAPNRYCPDRKVSRAELASFLDRAYDLPATSEDFFTDDDGLAHEDAINRVAAAGITQGCSATEFCPAVKVTREQAAAFLHRASGE